MVSSPGHTFLKQVHLQASALRLDPLNLSKVIPRPPKRTILSLIFLAMYKLVPLLSSLENSKALPSEHSALSLRGRPLEAKKMEFFVCNEKTPHNLAELYRWADFEAFSLAAIQDERKSSVFHRMDVLHIRLPGNS